MGKRIIVAVLLCGILKINSTTAQVRLPGLVADSMIVQRDVRLKIWGWAAAGEKINVNFRGKNYKISADEHGEWFVWIPPVKAGGPYDMKITGRNKITLKNIMVGDVWICSGQSNMVHYFDLHKERYGEEMASVNIPEIRQFTIPTLTNLQGPADDFSQGEWKAANRQNIGRFSVVAYFFARQLFEAYHVPVGIINASVGGTPIEAWTSEKGLAQFPEILEVVRKNKDSTYVNRMNRVARASRRERAKMPIRDKGLTGQTPWYDTTYVPEGWRTINIPGYWEDQGIENLDGAVWYRKEIFVPASMTGVDAKVALGRIVDADYLYVNGELVGNTTYQYPQRRYQIRGDLLKSGKNIFTIRVINNSGKGGFVPDKPYYLESAGQTIDLKGYWQYKVGEVYNHDEPLPAGVTLQYQPTALYNAMIAPITNFPVKGFVWYQGESNADRPREYKKLLPALVDDWRAKWNQEQAPFLFVQLPNFMDMNYSPSESTWAELREAQFEALRIPHTGMAVAIDLGEWNDIHPDNKKPIGDRLALAARKVAYEEDLTYSGPIYQSSRVEGSRIRLIFTQIGSGLISIDGEELTHFAVAGSDKKFVWANAVIEGDNVIVWSDVVPEPRFVRYAWADNPQGANLYNKERLPASPFRTDN